VLEEGGGGEGLKAKNSAQRMDDTSVSGKSKQSTTTKKTLCSKKTTRSSVFWSTAMMYKSDGTKQSSRSSLTTRGLSIADKTLASDGKACKGGISSLKQVMATVVDKAIGGALAFSELDPRIDNDLNKRASCDLWLLSGVVLTGGTLECCPSSQNPWVLVITFGLSS
jgi:hypothetical protein